MNALKEENIARQHAIEQQRETRKFELEKLHLEFGLHKLRLEPKVFGQMLAKAMIPETTPIKEEKRMDGLRVVQVKGEQEIVNFAIYTGSQIPVIREDVVEGQNVNNRGTNEITSAFGGHEMGELKVFDMKIDDPRHGVVPISINLVNYMLICSTYYEGLIENSQLVHNPAILRVSSKKKKLLIQ
ncbi:hypothetical protein TNIN_165741 [Trichonephila inaurata madagascariensis]|uniref:Uncharacterized protein n=1 Tax=Trichonephila inaurata madagascariensis TaxID=2747483 RepID=A0A8X6XSB3_9ARAC|nr:hypothetical protein TNIN_165741 [Trichonephila inaurata madagascariensis]